MGNRTVENPFRNDFKTDYFVGAVQAEHYESFSDLVFEERLVILENVGR